LNFYENEVIEGVKEAEAGVNRAMRAAHVIVNESLYLQYIDTEGRHIYPDSRSYLLGEGPRLGLARSTFYKHEKTMRLWEWLGRSPDEMDLLGGLQPVHHLKAVAESIDRFTGEVTGLRPEAENRLRELAVSRGLEVGDATPRDLINAAVDTLVETAVAAQEDESEEEVKRRGGLSPLPKDEVIKFFRGDAGGRPDVKPIKRELPNGLMDFGWIYDGEIGWFSEDVPPQPVRDFYLSRTGAVDYD